VDLVDLAIPLDLVDQLDLVILWDLADQLDLVVQDKVYSPYD
jgi:hypothetical protein